MGKAWFHILPLSPHNFREWISFGRDSLLTTNDPIEWEKRTRYSDLLANALILQSVVDMTRVIHQLVQEGYPFSPEYLSFFSPTGPAISGVLAPTCCALICLLRMFSSIFRCLTQNLPPNRSLEPAPLKQTPGS